MRTPAEISGASKSQSLVGAIRTAAERINHMVPRTDGEVVAALNAARILELCEELSEVITTDQLAASLAMVKK